MLRIDRFLVLLLKMKKACMCSGYIPMFVHNDEKSMFVLCLYSHFRVKDEKACLCSVYIPIFVLKMKAFDILYY